MTTMAIKLSEKNLQTLTASAEKDTYLNSKIEWITNQFAFAARHGRSAHLVVTYKIVGLSFVPDSMGIVDSENFANRYANAVDCDINFAQVIPAHN